MKTAGCGEIIIDHAKVASPESVNICRLERLMFSRALIRNSKLRTDQDQFSADVADLRNRGFAVVVES